jgi:hypothetical protein
MVGASVAARVAKAILLKRRVERGAFGKLTDTRSLRASQIWTEAPVQLIISNKSLQTVVNFDGKPVYIDRCVNLCSVNGLVRRFSPQQVTLSTTWQAPSSNTSGLMRSLVCRRTGVQDTKLTGSMLVPYQQ